MPGSRPRDDWQFIALDVMPDHVHLFVKAHPTDSPSHVANQFKGLTSRVGVTHFLTTSAGEHVPRAEHAHAHVRVGRRSAIAPGKRRQVRWMQLGSVGWCSPIFVAW